MYRLISYALRLCFYLFLLHAGWVRGTYWNKANTLHLKNFTSSQEHFAKRLFTPPSGRTFDCLPFLCFNYILAHLSAFLVSLTTHFACAYLSFLLVHHYISFSWYPDLTRCLWHCATQFRNSFAVFQGHRSFARVSYREWPLSSVPVRNHCKIRGHRQVNGNSSSWGASTRSLL